MYRCKVAFLCLVLVGLFLSACQPLVIQMDSNVTPPEVAANEAEVPVAESEAMAEEDRIASALSAGPAVIAAEARVMDWPGGTFPDEPGVELVELRPGSSGWTCIPDDRETPGNDPMCLNETYLAALKARLNKVDPPSTGIGIGYMLQEGIPAGSPPHMMVFVPGSKEGLTAFTTDPGPLPWVMFPETPYEHLMVTMLPQPEAVSAEADRIASALSAGPAVIAAEARVMDWPEGTWPDEPGVELVELRPGSNGWTCIPDDRETPGNDPLCLNETYLAALKARLDKIDPPSTGIGIGYMLQEGIPAGSPPHMMVFVPGSKEGLTAFGTDPGPLPWVMFPETPYEHLMVTMIYGDD